MPNLDVLAISLLVDELELSLCEKSGVALF